MRLLGERHWLGRARLAAAASCVALLALSASASAATTRYAAPSGVTSGACTVTDPRCDLKYAVESAAASGDTVVVTAGTYLVGSPVAAAGRHLRGDGTARPRLVGAAGLTGPTLTVSGSATVNHLRIESQSAQVALDLTGTGTDLELYSSAGDAARLHGASELSTAVVYTSAAGATALSLTDGLLSGAIVRHATVIAAGGGSTGIDATGLSGVLGLIGAPNVVSSIVSGTSKDVSGDLTNTVNLDYSSYRTAASAGVAGNDGTNVDAAAVLVNPTGFDFQQQPTSPTVNAGNNSDAAAVDLAGNPRVLGGVADIGAYELPILPDVSTGAASLVTDTTARLGATVNPRGDATTFEFRYGTTNPPLVSTVGGSAGSGSTGAAVRDDLTGLKPGTTYHFRVSATNASGTSEGAVVSFTTPSVAPTATTGAAGSLTATSARVSANVNPGGAFTTAQVEWGTDTTYGNATASQSLGSGSANVAFAADLTGLLPGTTYHYRVAATNVNGTSVGGDQTFATATRAPIASAVTASGVTTSAATLGGHVDPGGALTTWSFQYGIGNYDAEIAGTDLNGSTAQAVTQTLTGLLPGRTYGYRLVAANVNGAATAATGTFATPVAAPSGTTGAASGVGSRAATVAGTINPGGGATNYRFEYGPTAAYGESTTTTAAGNGTDPMAVGAALSGLDPLTDYHYRIVVDNAAGTATGADATFTTPSSRPAVGTGIATGVSQRSAGVTASIDPGGLQTTYHFDYGRTAAYGHTTATTTLPAGKSIVQVTSAVNGLEPGVTYRYRVVAQNSDGQTVGGERTFATPAEPRTDTTPPGGDPDGTDGDPPADDPPADDPAPPGDGPVQADGLPVPTLSPPVGRSANAAPVSGTVRVRVPGSGDFVELTEGAGIPIGSVVDASDGAVTITTASDTRGGAQSANFTGSEFKVLQRRAAKPITDIVLTGGTLNECTPRILTKLGDVTAAGRRKWSRRRLWGNGHGRFRTRGRHGTATVRGTWWLTEDRCDGTLVRVKRGLVEVRDLELRKTVYVAAGESYFARSRALSRSRRKKAR
jgi:phosphodiesterase/alkaline phosphatase D-like protein